MADGVKRFGSLTREFYTAEIGTWENYGGKRVWWFIGGRYNEVVLYIELLKNMAARDLCTPVIRFS